MGILLDAIVAAVLAGLTAIAVNRLFPKWGDWLPVTFATFIPPLIYVAISVYRALVTLGMAAGPDGTAAPGSIGLFMTAVGGYVVVTVTWLLVAVPASFAALHFFRRK